MNVIPYSRDLPIRNAQSLPAGTGCRYLLCIRGEGTDLVAKRWCRKLPRNAGANEVAVEFRPRTEETKARPSSAAWQRTWVNPASAAVARDGRGGTDFAAVAQKR